MDAIQFDSKAKSLLLTKVPVPTSPQEDEVIIKVAYAGVCGTDIHIIEGEFPCKSTPVILGHEFSGVVTEVGSAITHISRGDNVVVDPNSACNMCQFCTGGRYNQCQISSINNTVGIFRDGGWATYCRVPAAQVFKLPKSIPLEQGALCEPMSCISHGWDRLQPVDMGSRFLVQGAGIIGALWACTLHHLGHRNVIVSEINAERRKIIQKLGLGFQVVHPDELKAKDAAFGVDICIDCSGSAPAMESAMSFLKPGGKLLVFGVAAPHARMSVSPFDIYKKEITIIGVMVNPFSFNKSLGFLEGMCERYLNYEKLGIQTFPLNKYQDAFPALKKGDISKVIFRL